MSHLKWDFILVLAAFLLGCFVNLESNHPPKNPCLSEPTQSVLGGMRNG